MKVRMKIQIAGSRNGVRWPAAGETKDLPEQEALDLFAAGLAEPVAEQPETRPAPEPVERQATTEVEPAAPAEPLAETPATEPQAEASAQGKSKGGLFGRSRG